MKKTLLFLAVFSFFFSLHSTGQCNSGLSGSVSRLVVRDTTYELAVADTSMGTAGYTFTWAFSDGTVFNGPVLKKPFTTTDYQSYTLTTSGPGGCNETYYDYMDCNFVFNCAHFLTNLWGSFSPYDQIDGTDGNTVRLNFQAWDNYEPLLMNRMRLDWGNGNVVRDTLPASIFFDIGGPSDPTHSSHYQYSGEYVIKAAYSYAFDTMTCPYVAMDTISIHVGGPVAHPIFNGSLSLCAGDTLRVTAVDTTSQFHNMLHVAANRQGVVLNAWPNYYSPSDYFTYVANNTSYSFEWFDKYRNFLSGDTLFSINNVSLFDSGLYYLHIHEDISQRDTEFSVHVQVSGSTIALDSIVSPGCGVSNGAIYLNCFRANDSVSVSYLADGMGQVFNGRTNSTGHLKIAGLPVGVYSNIRLQFAGDACRSNTIVGPMVLHNLPFPTTGDTAITICAGGTVTLTASSTIAGANYVWAGPAGFTSTVQSPVITGISALSGGLYSVSVISGGCESSLFKSVRVTVITGLPTLTSIILPDSVCPGVTFGQQTADITWSSSDTNVVRVWGTYLQSQAAGTAAVTRTITNACGSTSLTNVTHVKSGAVLPPITGPDFICPGDTVNYHIATTGGFWRVQGAGSHYADSITGRVTATSATWGANYLSVYYTKRINTCTISTYKNFAIDSPYLSPFFGASSIFPGDSILTAPYPLGEETHAWTSGNTSIATVNSGGMVFGVSPGTATITYTAGNSCGTTTKVREMHVGDWMDTRIAGVSHRQVGYGISGETFVNNISAMDAQLLSPSDVTTDTGHNIYILETTGIIQRIDKEGLITKVCGMPDNFDVHGSYLYTGDNGPAVLAKIVVEGANIICDQQGNLYLTDPSHGVIRKIDRNGIIKIFAGTFVPNYYGYGPAIAFSYSGDGGAATSAMMTEIGSIAADNAGNIYVTNGHRIRKINSSGIITTIAGTGAAGNTGDGGLAINATLSNPAIAVDRDGALVVNSNGVFRRIDASGFIHPIVTTTGTASPYYSKISCDKQGNIFFNNNYGQQYVSNGYYYLIGDIKKIDTAGVITAEVGGARNIDYPDYGPSMRINGAFAFSADDSGGVYIGDNYNNTVRKEGKPSLELHATPNALCIGPASITFTAQGHNTGRAASYQWAKNGTSVGTDSYLYTDAAYSAGDTISCKVYAAVGGMYLATAKIGLPIITNPPVISPIAGMNVVCVADSITLTDTASGGVWASNNSAVTVVNGTVVGITAGSSIITYTLTNACGTATDTMMVTINPLPNAGMLTGVAVVCEGSSITLSNTVTGGAWSSSTASATVASGVVSGVSAGTAIISYTSTNACGTAIDTIEVTVNLLPNAGMLTGVPVVCEGSSITLSNTATGGAWSSSTTGATVASGVVTGVSAGSAIISYTSTNACGIAIDTIEVTVNPLPTSISISGPTTACVGSNITLTGGPLGASWTSSNGCATVGGGLVSGVYAGTTVIMCSMSNSCGTASDTMLITVVAQPGAGLTSGVNVMCAGAIATLTNSGGLPGGTWSSSNDAVATVTNGVVSGVATGTSIISYSFTNYCGTATDTLEMTVNGLPAPGTISGADSICEGSSVTLIESVTGGIWSSSAATIGTVTSAGIFTAVHEGEVEVTYSVTGICGTSVAFRTLHVIASAACDGGTGVRTSFNIYPDPNNGSFTVEIPQPGNNAEITVMDVTGRKIQTITPQAGQLLVPVELANMPSGTYLVKLIADGKVYSGKVVIR